MVLALLLSLSMAQAAVTGTVRDASGAAVPGATVILRDGTGGQQQTVTGPDGRFELDRPEGAATLIVRAGGFAVVEQALGGGGDVEIELQPANLLETVTVTPGRTEQQLGGVPASVTILDSTQIAQSAAVVADDVLRQAPTFSLFRRTSSLSSHPTSQGVSLRGIGPSGVSRTLVLVDNIPFNDIFGGWVYWTRVPLGNVDRVEIVEGPSSNVYGNYAMGGVINIVSNRPAPRTVELRTQYGNKNSPKFDFFGSDVWGKLGIGVEGSFFDTEGFPAVIENERGPVDTKAAVTFRNVNVKLDYAPGSRVGTFVRAGYFSEERDNGKVATLTNVPEANDTTWSYVSGGVRAQLPDGSDLQARVSADFETFSSNFVAISSVNQPRDTGRQSLGQTVPTDGASGMVQWSRAFGLRNFVMAGGDWRWVDGESQETVFDFARGVNPVTFRESGGTQRSLGAFIQDVLSPSDNLSVTLAARVDRWRNYKGHNYERSASTGLPTPNDTELEDRDDTVVTPRIAASYRLSDQARVWGGYSLGFRAPTLNELYRQFRVGAVTTLANPELGPERLKGGELGLNLAPSRDVTVRATWYDNRVEDAVSNVTIRTTPTLITRQRQNAGLTRIWGIQSDVDYRPSATWRFSGAYLFNQAKFKEFDENPGLVENYIPQVPKHRGSLQAAYSDPRFLTLAMAVQFFGRQFDDDENLATVPGESEPGLPGYATVDITASRALHNNVDVFVGAQNIFNKEYIVGTSPTTIGSPALVHGGVRVRLTGW